MALITCKIHFSLISLLKKILTVYSGSKNGKRDE